MSFILDALRKAEAERERGAVPSIHAQPTHAGGAAPGRARPTLPPWFGAAAAGTASLLLAAAAWVVYSSGRGAPLPDAIDVATAPMRVSPQSADSAPIAAPIAAPITAPATAPTTAARATPGPAPASATGSVAPPTANAPIAPRAAPAADAPEPAVRPLLPRAPEPTARSVAGPKAETDASGGPLPQAAPKPEAKPAAVPSVGVAAPAAAPATTPAAAAASASRVYATNELPDDIRRQLPALVVGGSMYSPTPANRIVILGGQVFHEGDRITPDLLLHQIKPKSAVLGFKGYRYELMY